MSMVHVTTRCSRSAYEHVYVGPTTLYLTALCCVIGIERFQTFYEPQQPVWLDWTSENAGDLS